MVRTQPTRVTPPVPEVEVARRAGKLSLGKAALECKGLQDRLKLLSQHRAMWNFFLLGYFCIAFLVLF